MQTSDSNLQVDIRGATILVVDDEPFNLTLIDKMLSADGYQNIITVEDPRDVMDVYAANQVDLMLLDINMPYMDGFEIIDLLKEKYGNQTAPILVLTAQSLQEFRIKALDSGARDYVTKPFDRHELIARVRNLLELQLTNRYLHGQNDLLESRVQQHTQELHETQEQMLKHLGRAAEYRENESSMHMVRVAELSALLGRAMALSENDVRLLYRASPLHDLGKIGIPDHILLKKEALSDEEEQIMRSHVQIGADILADKSSPFVVLAREIALHHHEKWDGSGYPQGLAGEDIPLPARIVALAETFDSMMSAPPNKEAWSFEQAVSYVESHSGSYFQPELVQHFMDCLDEIRQIQEKFPEPDQ